MSSLSGGLLEVVGDLGCVVVLDKVKRVLQVNRPHVGYPVEDMLQT
jgi:hypothetical protein